MMCLGVPGKVLEIQENALRTARVQFGGVVREVALVYVPEVQVGDWVLVHAGIGIRRLSPKPVSPLKKDVLAPEEGIP